MYTEEELRQIGQILEKVKPLAIAYQEITDRPLGITAEVAEYEAATKLNCALCAARTGGHDMIDREGKTVQVKGRVVVKKGSQRVGLINKSTDLKPWDYVVLVLLDQNYQTTVVYKADQPVIEAALAGLNKNGKPKNRNMAVSQFISIAKKIWPA